MKEETASLLQKAEESIKAAEVLLSQGFREFSAARAYYALFYAAEALLFEEGLQFSKHAGVHAAFGERFVKTGRFDTKFHRYLLDAFDQRLLADYEAAKSVSEEAADTTINRAKEFLAAARNYSEESHG